MIQSFLTFDSMDRIPKCDHSWKAVEKYFTVVLFVIQFYPVCNKFLENLSILDLVLSRVKGLIVFLIPKCHVSYISCKALFGALPFLVSWPYIQKVL